MKNLRSLDFPSIVYNRLIVIPIKLFQDNKQIHSSSGIRTFIFRTLHPNDSRLLNRKKIPIHPIRSRFMPISASFNSPLFLLILSHLLLLLLMGDAPKRPTMSQQGRKWIGCNGKALGKELFANIYLVTNICQALV